MDSNNKLLIALYGHYLVMKTFHFQTASGFRHTKVDEYIVKYLANLDRLMEVIQGIDSVVTIKDIHVRVTAHNDENIMEEVGRMIKHLETQRDEEPSVNAILDQMQGDLQQLAYVFRFQ